MLMGRWHSDAFLRYVRKQVLETTKGMSSIMLKNDFYHALPRLDAPSEDPRTRNHQSFASTHSLASMSHFPSSHLPSFSLYLWRSLVFGLQRKRFLGKQDIWEIMFILANWIYIYIYLLVLTIRQTHSRFEVKISSSLTKIHSFSGFFVKKYLFSSSFFREHPIACFRQCSVKNNGGEY